MYSFDHDDDFNDPLGTIVDNFIKSQKMKMPTKKELKKIGKIVKETSTEDDDILVDIE